jgi:hypothetical protein
MTTVALGGESRPFRARGFLYYPGPPHNSRKGVALCVYTSSVLSRQCTRVADILLPYGAEGMRSCPTHAPKLAAFIQWERVTQRSVA